MLCLDSGSLGAVPSPAAHQDTTMGNMPAQMVSRGMMMYSGAVSAPTMYDHTPEQYMIFMNRLSLRCASGQYLENMIWKCPCAAQTPSAFTSEGS